MKGLKRNAYKNKFYDCFNVYNMLMDEDMQQDFKQVKICVTCKWQTF